MSISPDFKKNMLAGKKVAGTMIRVVRNPAIAYIAKNAGLDFVMYDCEHSNYDMQTLHDGFITLNALGVAGLVRVPNGTREQISRVLDAGATGVMVPMVETAEMAETLVKYAKFQPVGGRGFCSGCANSGYANGNHATVMDASNKAVVAIAQIETKLAIDNVDAIAAVAGIDLLMVGPNDLSISLGIPGELENPIELEAIAKVAAACKKHGKAFGLHAGLALHSKFAADLQFVMCSNDTDVLTQGFAGIRTLCDGL